MQTALIIALGALSFWLGWKLLWIKKGIASLTRTLESEEMPTRQLLPGSSLGADLEHLSIVAADALTEAGLIRDSEKRQRLFLEALLNEIKDAIFILDENREIRFVNEAAKTIFPSDQPYIGRAFIDVCRDHRIYDTLELADEIGAKVSDQIELRTSGEAEERIREMILLIEAEPLTFSSIDERRGSWILMRDVTSQMETEQIRRDFVANASHELRTPLSIINGYLETMEDEDIDLNSSSIKRAIGTMMKHGKRLARIVDDMLTISKLESASDLLSSEPFDLRESLEDMLTQLMPLVEEYGARIKLEIDESAPWVITGDRFYWDQIFFNLIENALKQNPEPGLRIRISFHKAGGRLEVKISDDGIGIPAKDLPLVFKRFFRVQKHHAQNEIKGTGLGLSIVKRAVEAHHGTISVKSIPGLTTEFTISVPMQGNPTAGQTAEKPDRGQTRD